jgi:hypothetical protein
MGGEYLALQTTDACGGPIDLGSVIQIEENKYSGRVQYSCCTKSTKEEAKKAVEIAIFGELVYPLLK